MTALHDTLRRYVDDGSVPGAVALVARGDEVEVVAVGHADVGGESSMARDSLFRIASVTKPVTAAAVLMLVEEGRIGLDDPVDAWLPELAKPVAVRTPASPLDDLVPAARPITVEDLLSSRAGWGFPSDFALPAVRALFEVQKDGRAPQAYPAPDVWLADLARVPLLHQPGEAWLYGTCSDLQGVLISRVSGRGLPEFLAERIFEPLGMTDTAFEVPAAKRDRFTTYYRRAQAAPWRSRTPRAASGAGSPPSRPVAGVSSRRPTTTWPSPACCWVPVRRTAGGCCRPPR